MDISQIRSIVGRDMPISVDLVEKLHEAIQLGPDEQSASMVLDVALALAQLEGELGEVKRRLKEVEDTGITKPIPPGTW